MTIDARNIWTGMVGVVTQPEFVTENILTFRAAVDGAGRERDSDNYSGYFDVKYFLNDNNPNAKFVKSQVEAGNIKVGSQLGVVGQIMHERWEKDGQKNSKVAIYAETLTYIGRRQTEDGGGTGGGTGGSSEGSTEKTATADIPQSF